MHTLKHRMEADWEADFATVDVSPPLDMVDGCAVLLLVLWPFSRADLTKSEADLLRSPLLPACLILHANGISSIDHGCRSVCRCLHRSVCLITHSHSSARLLISPRPLSLPYLLFLALSLPCSLSLSSPCFLLPLAHSCFLTHIFLIRQKSKTKYEYS